MEPRGTYSDSDIQEFIMDMKRVAKTAHQEAATVRDMFRSNRVAFAKLTGSIPSTIERVEFEQRQHNAEGSVARTRVSIAYGTAATSLAATSSILTGIYAGATVFPPALIILPIALPFVAFIAGIFGAKQSQEASKRDTESHQCAIAMRQLDGALKDLSEFGQYIDQLADYWVEMESMLQNIHDHVGNIQADDVSRLRIEELKDSWGAIKESYLEYKVGVSRIQDLNPWSKQLE